MRHITSREPARTSPLRTVKRVIVGRPISSEDAAHHRLSKLLALPVFSSDALSSVAYATEEMLKVLLPVAGLAAFRLITPLSMAILTVVGILVVSYRQTIKAYPSAGGAYIVTRDNFGLLPAQVAGAALLTDYVLTVAVSVSAGVAAVVSVFGPLYPYRVLLGISFIALITLANLRGLKESGTIFAIPTYGFVVSILGLIGLGLWRLATHHLTASSAAVGGGPIPKAAGAIGVFLVLHAFASGSTAMTGIEAISNGVPAFRPPEWKNARSTLVVMGVLLASLFLGISVLATHVRAVPTERQTLLSLLARAVLGASPAARVAFFVVQALTMLILVLAANTSFQDFPRLASFIAGDRYLPGQLQRVGERLVFSNGILVLAGFASLLVVVFQASVERLIPLYAIGVFTSFTMSQAGMAKHHVRLKERNWRLGLVINGTGAVATTIVLIVVAVTRFSHGAWIILIAIPVLVAIFVRIRAHYSEVGRLLRDPQRRPPDAAPPQRVAIAVDGIGPADRHAAAYASRTGPVDIRMVHIGPTDYATLLQAWSSVGVVQSLDVVPTTRSLPADLRGYVRDLRREVGEDEILNIIVPEHVRTAGIRHLLRRPTIQLLKAALLPEPGVVVSNVTHQDGDGDAEIVVRRHVAILLVSAVHNATLNALRFAKTLRADEMHCLHIEIDKEQTKRVVNEWEAWSPGAPLEVLHSEYRQIADPILEYVRSLQDEDRSTIFTIVLPEFVVWRWWQNLLHNQTGLLLKQAFLFEPSVVVASVPYRLRPGEPAVVVARRA